ncbi:MAG: hypothetical protein EXS00_06175 [Phycisphaerales bacterium]|nr:hypothetical protein [Phycisphaerales bacterium]
MSESIGVELGGRGAFAIAVVVALFALSGCQSGYRDNAKLTTNSLRSGDFAQAQSHAGDGLKSCSDRDRLCCLLEAGRTSQLAGDIESSIALYDQADAITRPFLSDQAEAKISEAVTTTLVNQTMSEYRGTPAERIMLNSLQALNRMSMGDMAGARVDLNRSLVWQQVSAHRFAEEIDAEQRAAFAAAKGQSIDLGSGSRDPRLEQLTASVQDLHGYALFANPFATYLRAVFLLASSRDAGDMENARADLKQVMGMEPSMQSLAGADLLTLDDKLRGVNPPYTWILFLSGLAPYYDEFRLDIPIPVGRVNYVSAAFPVLKRNDALVEGFAAEAGGSSTQAALLSDMDRIVGEQYRLRLPGIIAQEVASSAIKAAAVWASSTYGSGNDSTAAAIIQIAGIIYQATSTAADLRVWHSMPKRIYALRLPTPDDGNITLKRPDGSALTTVYVKPSEGHLLTISLPSPESAAPSIMTADFPLSN